MLLVEKDDLAAGTSGRSTKLLHGGLRYLEHGHLRLVREALREREITARLAPALALPLRFVMPVRAGEFPGRFAARVGVALYDLLAGDHPLSRGRGVSARELAALAPGLATGWSGGVSFADRQTDDASSHRGDRKGRAAPRGGPPLRGANGGAHAIPLGLPRDPPFRGR